MIMYAIKEKYFDKGLRTHLCDKYETVGKIMGKQYNICSFYLRFVFSASLNYTEHYLLKGVLAVIL